MMKKLTINLVVATLLILIGFSSYSDSAIAIEAGKITSDAQEFIYVAPDTATISFTVETEDKNPQNATKTNDEKVKKLLAVIKPVLAENETIKTSSYNLNPIYEYNKDIKKSIQTGYAVTNTLTVKLKDTAKVGKIINIATQNGAKSISGLSFTLETKTDVCKELTQKAVLKAKADAQTVLAPLGKKIKGISSINYSCSTNTNFPTYKRNYMMAAGPTQESASADVAIEEGEIRVTASVTIVFTIR